VPDFALDVVFAVSSGYLPTQEQYDDQQMFVTDLAELYFDDSDARVGYVSFNQTGAAVKIELTADLSLEAVADVIRAQACAPVISFPLADAETGIAAAIGTFGADDMGIARRLVIVSTSGPPAEAAACAKGADLDAASIGTVVVNLGGTVSATNLDCLADDAANEVFYIADFAQESAESTGAIPTFRRNSARVRAGAVGMSWRGQREMAWTKPTLSPTSSPSKSPTKRPTRPPSRDSPTESPTKSPTKSPTESPSRSPTESPSKSPTQSPTKSPGESQTQSRARAQRSRRPSRLRARDRQGGGCRVARPLALLTRHPGQRPFARADGDEVWRCVRPRSMVVSANWGRGCNSRGRQATDPRTFG